MFENVINFFKRIGKKDQIEEKSKDTAKERLHLVLMQDRANVSADFLDMMRQEIIEVIKKYIDVDEKDIDVRLTNKTNEDGTMGAPALYANIPITGIKEDMKKEKETKEEESKEKEENNKNQEDEDTEKEIVQEEKAEETESNEEELNSQENEETVPEQEEEEQESPVEDTEKDNEENMDNKKSDEK